MEVLYISYDGITDNLGQSQIMPYIRKLSNMNIIFSLLTFEKRAYLRNKPLIKRIESGFPGSISWSYLKYHKRPSALATFYDIIRGFFVGFWIVKRKRIKVIHSRIFIGSVIALLIGKACRARLILDVRGFWPEERVEGGLWRRDGWLFKMAKFIEKTLILNADEIVVLTIKAKQEIEQLPYLKNKNWL